MPRMDNAYALIIGVANYQNINRLPATILKDATDIYKLLVSTEQCGYLQENVQLLLDDQATSSALRQALTDLSIKPDQSSTVFIYMTCHGAWIESGPFAGEYLLPVDVDLDSADLLARTAISGTEFTRALTSIVARKVVVVFDCCHAGGIGQLKGAFAPVVKACLPESYYEVLKSGTGRVILASSRSNEFSYVLPNAENSLFTHHLLNGLRGNAATHGEDSIKIFDLFEYVQPRVTNDHPKQHPIFKAELEENFTVARYPRDKGGTGLQIADRQRDGAHTATVRQFLLASLNEQELREIITDYFPDVNSDLGSKYSFRDVVDALISYCAKQGRIRELVTRARHINPYQYNLFKLELEQLQD
jgi:hypothetical protein